MENRDELVKCHGWPKQTECGQNLARGPKIGRLCISVFKHFANSKHSTGFATFISQSFLVDSIHFGCKFHSILSMAVVFRVANHSPSIENKTKHLPVLNKNNCILCRYDEFFKLGGWRGERLRRQSMRMK